jgi:peroxiredoxin
MTGTRMNRLRRRLLAPAVFAVGAGLATFCSAAVAPASAAPDFTLRSSLGQNLRLHEQRGQVVMVNFWASWCGPCKVELPHLNKLYDRYRGSGFVLLGVNIDEDPRLAASIAQRMGLNFPILLDSDKAVAKRYDLGTMPSTVIIDRDGRVRQIHLGYRDGLEATYEKQVRDLLKE